MEYTISALLSWDEMPESPKLEPGEEYLKLAVSKLKYVDRTVDFMFHISYMFPYSVASRYVRPGEGLVLVVSDVDQQDCFSRRMINDPNVVRYPPGSRDGPNLVSEPPNPLPPVGRSDETSFDGGWINGEISFKSPDPAHVPSVYLYVILENFISNIIGLDIIEGKIVNF